MSEERSTAPREEGRGMEGKKIVFLMDHSIRVFQLSCNTKLNNSFSDNLPPPSFSIESSLLIFQPMDALTQGILSLFSHIDPLAIFVLMAVESSIIPFPSEVVMIPAGVAAAQGHIDPFVAVAMGGLGSLAGALANYYIVGKWLGKPFLLKYGKYFLITADDYHRAEALFQQNANLYTFVGRLIPVVRQLISVPAGIFGMRLLPFMFLTTLGATIWSAVLVGVGYFFGMDAIRFVQEYSSEVAIVAIPAILFYIWWKIFRKK
jgi:membrane protein DedA with SNARE-associated domain